MENRANLKQLAKGAEKLGKPELPGSGNQEGLESIVNQILFG
jgi:xylose isomerase